MSGSSSSSSSSGSSGYSITLTTGSGANWQYSGSPGSGGFYTPTGVYQNGLQLVINSGQYEWAEIYPNGFQILYGMANVPSSSSSSSSYSSSSSLSSSSAAYNSIEYTPCGGSSSGYSSSSASSNSSRSSGSSSSSSSSSSSEFQCPPTTIAGLLGLQTNLLPPAYLAPYVGVPVDVAHASGEADQPRLCAVDQEEAKGAGSYLHPGIKMALEQAVAVAGQLAHGFTLLDRNTGNNFGRTIAACQVNLASGNLVASFTLPSAGTVDPPLKFTYNSLSSQVSAFGGGWTSIYEAQLAAQGQGVFYPYRIQSPASASTQWNIYRNSASGPVQYITDPVGRTTTFTYDSLGLLSTVVDSSGRATTFTMNPNYGLLEAIEWPDGTITTLTYALNSGQGIFQLAEWINPEGDITTFTYDPVCGLLEQVETPEGEKTQFIYDGLTQRVMIDAVGDTIKSCGRNKRGGVT